MKVIIITIFIIVFLIVTAVALLPLTLCPKQRAGYNCKHRKGECGKDES